MLVEYGDYECPSCAATQVHVEKLLAERDDVCVVFRHFPLTSVHPTAGVAAQAAEAAAAQGKFWPMHHALYESPGGDPTNDLDATAMRIGLELYRFNNDLTSGIYAPKVAADVDGGKRSGVTGTPTFFLNGRRLKLRSPADLAAELE